MKVTVHLRSKSGAVIAFCPDLPGCSASAPTQAEALELLRRRVGEYFTTGTSNALPGTRVIQLEV
jgi:predicted RNase H-like HicB family nuclease